MEPWPMAMELWSATKKALSLPNGRLSRDSPRPRTFHLVLVRRVEEEKEEKSDYFETVIFYK